MRIGIGVQIRMNSTRLPGKAMMCINKKPLFLFLLDRLRDKLKNYSIIAAISEDSSCDIIEKIAKKNQYEVFRGPELNVFERFKQLVLKYNLDTIVRLTGDNPLIDLDLINYCIKMHDNRKYYLTSTRIIDKNRKIQRFTPSGQSVDVINAEILAAAPSTELSDFEKEHVIPYFYLFKDKINIIKDFDKKLEGFSIDTLEDYILLINRVCK